MRIFGITDKGKVRKENQDSYIIENCEKRKCSIVAICDGMGGAKAGDLASRLACKSFATGLFDALLMNKVPEANFEKLLKKCSAEANGVVKEYSMFDSEYDGMGTTLVGGIVCAGKAHIINIGDSRAYKISGTDITQITSDHSYVQELVSMGAITAEEAKNHPRKNVITRALGVDKSVEADYFCVDFKKGDYMLLCSDGLSNMVSDIEITWASNEEKNPEDLCKRLLRLCLDRGARDNVSIVAVKF